MDCYPMAVVKDARRIITIWLKYVYWNCTRNTVHVCPRLLPSRITK